MAPIALNCLVFARCLLIELSKLKDCIPEFAEFAQTPIDNTVIEMATESLDRLHSFCLRHYDIYKDEVFVVVGFDVKIKGVPYRFKRRLAIVRINKLSHYDRWFKTLAKKAVSEIVKLTTENKKI